MAEWHWVEVNNTLCDDCKGAMFKCVRPSKWLEPFFCVHRTHSMPDALLKPSPDFQMFIELLFLGLAFISVIGFFVLRVVEICRGPRFVEVRIDDPAKVQVLR